MIYKSYKINSFGVSVDDVLTLDEISNIHHTWRKIRDYPEWMDKSWNFFKDSLGLDFEVKALPNWTIKDKNKWLWAKLKYNF